MKTRLDYVDSLRAFAAYFVFAQHFVSWAAPWFLLGFFELTTPVQGLNSTFAITLFAVLIGYFARTTKSKTEVYIAKRFLQFSVMPFLISVCIYGFFLFCERVLGFTVTMDLFRQFYDYSFFNVIGGFLNDAVWVITDNIYRVLWTLAPFYAASVAICIIGKLFQSKNKWAEMAFCSALILFFFLQKSDGDWNLNLLVCFCFIGYLASCIKELELKIFASKPACYALVAVGFVVITQCGTSDAALLLQALVFAVVFLALMGAPKVQAALSFRPLVALGRISFHVYMWHYFIIFVVMELMYYCGVDPTAQGMVAWLSLGLCVGLTLLVSTVSYYFYDVFLTKKVIHPLLHSEP